MTKAKNRIETVAEFLDKGGRIEQIPTGISGDRGGIPTLNKEEMAAKGRQRKSEIHLCQAREHQPRYRKT